MSDDAVRTRITLVEGDEVDFQEYFVRLRHARPAQRVHYVGADKARAAPGVLEALEQAEVVVIAPSNPVLSIGPILSVPGVETALAKRRESVVAISPIVAGRALKGPADHLLAELGHDPSAIGVARIMAPIAETFILDAEDVDLVSRVENEGVRAVVADTVMRDLDVSAALARIAIDAAERT